MTHLTDKAGGDPAPSRRQASTRRQALGLLGAGAMALGFAPGPGSAHDDHDKVLTEALVLRDPEVPVIGNPNGDISIVEWFDYNCPYCRKVAPELRQVVEDDGKVRLVLKDWPILGEVSKLSARLVLAAKYQDKFLPAHEALIGVSSRLTEPRVRELLAAAKVDMDRLNKDIEANGKAIDAVLSRNNDQALAFEFRGTPAFIVGKYRVPGVLSMNEFEQVIADARKAKMSR
jgi:protein-disulfide isomerase